MTERRVSIVIPTFNRADFLQKAVETSLAQTCPCEVIVCDHGSTDETPRVMEGYGDRVKYIRRDQDLGPHFCWLEGVMHAWGEFVHIQYDDDWIAHDFIEKTLALMEPDVGMVFANGIILFENNGSRSELYRMGSWGYSTGIYDNRNLHDLIFERDLMISPGACLFRRQDVIDSLYQGNLPTLEKKTYHGVGPDHFMTLITLLRYEKFGYVDSALVYFRAHENSITIHAKADAAKKREMQRAYEAVREYYLMLEFFKTNQHCIRDIKSSRHYVWKKLKRKVQERLSLFLK